jgi:hypothetical protein
MLIMAKACRAVSEVVREMKSRAASWHEVESKLLGLNHMEVEVPRTHMRAARHLTVPIGFIISLTDWPAPWTIRGY